MGDKRGKRPGADVRVVGAEPAVGQPPGPTAPSDPDLALENQAEIAALKVRFPQFSHSYEDGAFHQTWDDFVVYHLGRAEDELSGRGATGERPPLRVAAAQVLEAVRLALDPGNSWKSEATTRSLLKGAGLIRAAISQRRAKKTDYPEKDSKLATLLRDRLLTEMLTAGLRAVQSFRVPN